MRARDHTRSMLRWWRRAGITLADLAVRRREGSMLWHREIRLADLPLAWARAENVRQAEVYIRPARGHPWPLVLLDDVPVATAGRVAKKYDALVVRTSPEGGCHLWLLCTEAVLENERRRAQRWLAERVDADPASTSGEHLGRLAGFRNWKRAGVWVNVLDAPHRNRPWTPQLAPGNDHERMPPPSRGRPVTRSATDSSASGREWGWVCGLLEAGCEAHIAYIRLAERARPRRGPDANRYAQRTVQRALSHVALRRATREPRENHERGG